MLASIVALVAFSLSVNVFPNVNNDGVDYIAYSRNLSGYGLVHLGYRQFGYPLFLAVTRAISRGVGIEALLFASLMQRLVLAIGLAYSIWLWRWKATVIAVIVITPSLMIYENFILTEALTVPLALILACLVGHHSQIMSSQPSDRDSTTAGTIAWTATIVALALCAIRYPLAVFGVVPFGLWFQARRRGYRRRSHAFAAAFFVVALVALNVGWVRENSEELGVSAPTARGERAAYWAAWNLVFTLNPENRTVPRLAEHFAGGSPFPIIWAIEERLPTYTDQARELENARDELLRAAGMAMGRERVFSVLGALRGGRMDEVRPRVQTMLATDSSTVAESIHWNDVSRRRGHGYFNDRYNDGSKPQAMITSPVFPAPPLPYITSLIKWLLPLALIATTVMAITKKQIVMGILFLAPPLAYSLFVGWILADNARFLMTTTIYAIAGAVALWAAARIGPHSIGNEASP